jgi:hypothetical protein
MGARSRGEGRIFCLGGFKQYANHNPIEREADKLAIIKLQISGSKAGFQLQIVIVIRKNKLRAVKPRAFIYNCSRRH